MDKVPTNKRGLVTSQDVSLDKEYIEWIHELKSRFRNSQIKAAVKVNSEQLLFNWQLGRDLVVRKAEEKWGTGIVNQVSLDLQAEFPEAKGFSARNLWFMKQWYSFYSVSSDTRVLISNLEGQINTHGSKLNQLGSEICEKKLNQPDSEMIFPSFFAFVPWKHHVMIVQKAMIKCYIYIKRFPVYLAGSFSSVPLDLPFSVKVQKLPSLILAKLQPPIAVCKNKDVFLLFGGKNEKALEARIDPGVPIGGFLIVKSFHRDPQAPGIMFIDPSLRTEHFFLIICLLKQSIAEYCHIMGSGFQRIRAVCLLRDDVPGDRDRYGQKQGDHEKCDEHSRSAETEAFGMLSQQEQDRT